jgi:hypothetical protein
VEINRLKARRALGILQQFRRDLQGIVGINRLKA